MPTMTGEGADGRGTWPADHLFRRPEDAPSLLNHATNVAAWTAREEIVSGVKPFAVKGPLGYGRWRFHRSSCCRQQEDCVAARPGG